MNTRKMMLVASVLCLAVLLAGCGPSTAAQLKKAQADLAACDKQAGELKAAVVQEHNRAGTLITERDKVVDENRFLAGKANSLQKESIDNAKIIADLKAELEKSKKTIEEMKAAAEKAPAAPAAPAAGAPQ